jgi:hypothetical protein
LNSCFNFSSVLRCENGVDRPGAVRFER